MSCADPVFPPGAQASFNEASKPLINWLNVNGHPHMKILVDVTGAEVLDGAMVFNTTEFVRD